MTALLFVWAWRDPVRHPWLFDYGLIACALVIPFALIFGGLRGIPLWLCRRDVAHLAAAEQANAGSPDGRPCR